MLLHNIISSLNLQKQGLQTELEEMYKPITRTISSGTTAVTKQLTDNYDKLQTKIEELTERMNTVSTTNTAEIKQQIVTLEDQQGMIELILNKMYNSPSFNEMVKLLRNHPNVIDKMNGEDVELNDNDTAIYNLVSNLPAKQQEVIVRYYSIQPITSTPKTKKLSDVLKEKSELFPEKKRK